MRAVLHYLAVVVVLCCLAVSGCSEGKGSKEAKKTQKTMSEEAAEAIQKYAREPMDKARATQRLGDDRTEAIDEVLKQ